MRLVLVGRRGNKRVIRWGSVGKASLVVTVLSSALPTLVYVTLARRWNPEVPLHGLIGGAGISLVLLVVNLLTPLNQLPFLPRER